MKNKQAHTLLIIITGLALILPILPAIVHATIPQKINYQGYLTDPQGTPIDDTVSIVFSIYSQASGGSALWTETQTVTVADGVFSANLGDTTPITLPFDTPYYLGTAIGSDSEMTPRQPLTSVAYAFRAKEADSVKDNAITTAVIADNAVITDKVADDAISGDKIAPATITSTNIANGAVGSSQIGDGAIDTEDLTDDAVTVDKISPNVISSIDGVSNDGGNVDLEAGSNITITPDDAANKITIASTGGGSSPWTESSGDVYRDSGNVGIGTTSPRWNLEINENIDAFVGLSITNENTGNGSSEGIYFGNEEGDIAGIRLDDNRMDIFNNRVKGSIYFERQGGRSITTLANNGNVGIGTTNPQAKLSFGTDLSTPRKIALWDDINDFYGFGLDLGRLTFFTNNTEKMTILDNGNVGIGTGSPQAKLHVVGISQFDLGTGSLAITTPGGWPGLIIFSNNGHRRDLNFNDYGMSITVSNSSSPPSTTDGICITESGNVGIGTLSPGYKLNVTSKGQGSVDAVYGYSETGNGVDGISTSGFGVYGESISGYAGYFAGNVYVSGNVSKSSGSFKIDHPMDPENKYLQHSFVESPDMMNVYNGNVPLDEKGEAWVELPDWFEALNRDFRYQLTPIGAPGPNLYVAEKITDNRFKIAGGTPQMEVSWQVTGIRQDVYARAHPINVEVEKPPEEQGYYLYPELHGQTEDKGIEWAGNPERMQRMKARGENKNQPNS